MSIDSDPTQSNKPQGEERPDWGDFDKPHTSPNAQPDFTQEQLGTYAIPKQEKKGWSRRQKIIAGIATAAVISGGIAIGLGSSNAGAKNSPEDTSFSQEEDPGDDYGGGETPEDPVEGLTEKNFPFVVQGEDGEYHTYTGIEALKEEYGVRKEVYTQNSRNPARASEEPFRGLIKTVNMIINYDASTPEQDAVIEDYKSEGYDAESAEILQVDYVTSWMMDGLLFDKSESENGTIGIYAAVRDNIHEIVEQRKSDDNVRYTYEGTMWSGQQGTPGIDGSMVFKGARITVNLKKESEDGETNMKKHWTTDVKLDKDGRYYNFGNTAEDDLL